MGAAEPTDGPDAQILVLRDPQTGEMGAVTDPDPEQLEQATHSAKERKAIWEHRAQGATARALTLDKSMTQALATGTVNLMFARILQDELMPKTAKEAAEVAKIAHEIASKQGGLADPKDLTAIERAKLIDDADRFKKILERRAAEAGADLSGALEAGEAIPETEPIENQLEDGEDEVHDAVED